MEGEGEDASGFPHRNSTCCTINLSLLMAKVTSLETIRPVSHLNVCALTIPHTPPTPGSCL